MKYEFQSSPEAENKSCKEDSNVSKALKSCTNKAVKDEPEAYDEQFTDLRNKVNKTLE